MANPKEVTKQNKILLKKMFKNMGLDSFLDGFSESIDTNKGEFYINSKDYETHTISGMDLDLEFEFYGDEDSVTNMVNQISEFFDKHDIEMLSN